MSLQTRLMPTGFYIWSRALCGMHGCSLRFNDVLNIIPALRANHHHSFSLPAMQISTSLISKGLRVQL